MKTNLKDFLNEKLFDFSDDKKIIIKNLVDFYKKDCNGRDNRFLEKLQSYAEKYPSVIFYDSEGVKKNLKIDKVYLKLFYINKEHRMLVIFESDSKEYTLNIEKEIIFFTKRTITREDPYGEEIWEE